MARGGRERREVLTGALPVCARKLRVTCTQNLTYVVFFGGLKPMLTTDAGSIVKRGRQSLMAIDR